MSARVPDRTIAGAGVDWRAPRGSPGNTTEGWRDKGAHIALRRQCTVQPHSFVFLSLFSHCRAPPWPMSGSSASVRAVCAPRARRRHHTHCQRLSAEQDRRADALGLRRRPIQGRGLRTPLTKGRQAGEPEPPQDRADGRERGRPSFQAIAGPLIRCRRKASTALIRAAGAAHGLRVGAEFLSASIRSPLRNRASHLWAARTNTPSARCLDTLQQKDSTVNAHPRIPTQVHPGAPVSVGWISNRSLTSQARMNNLHSFETYRPLST